MTETEVYDSLPPAARRMLAYSDFKFSAFDALQTGEPLHQLDARLKLMSRRQHERYMEAACRS